MTLNVKFHEILRINFRVALATNFYNTHRDRHFSEIVKSRSGHPKACKSIKNRKSKIFTKPILSSVFTEESKIGEREDHKGDAIAFFNDSL